MDVMKDSLIESFLAKRKAFLEDKAVDLREMSQTIQGATRECDRLIKKRDTQVALSQFVELEKYGPIECLPSYGVHRRLSALYQKLDDQLCQRHALLADAMAGLLLHKIGGGERLNDPIQLLLAGEYFDWLRVKTERLETAPLSGALHNGKMIYSCRWCGAPSRYPSFYFDSISEFYFEFPPRLEKSFHEGTKLWLPVGKRELRSIINSDEPYLKERNRRALAFRKLLEDTRDLSEQGDANQAADIILEFHKTHKKIWDADFGQLGGVQIFLKSIAEQVDPEKAKQLRHIVGMLEIRAMEVDR